MVYNIDDTIHGDQLYRFEAGIGAGAGIAKIVIIGLVLKSCTSSCRIVDLLQREGLHVWQAGFSIGAGIRHKLRLGKGVEGRRIVL